VHITVIELETAHSTNVTDILGAHYAANVALKTMSALNTIHSLHLAIMMTLAHAVAIQQTFVLSPDSILM